VRSGRNHWVNCQTFVILNEIGKDFLKLSISTPWIAQVVACMHVANSNRLIPNNKSLDSINNSYSCKSDFYCSDISIINLFSLFCRTLYFFFGFSYLPSLKKFHNAFQLKGG
jgi:hypothetical protein